jgi:hypothetical protein
MTNLPSVNVIEKEWKRDDVITLLQREDLNLNNLNLDNEYIEIIKSKKKW